MRKSILALLLAIAMLSTSVSGVAEATVADELPAVGATLHGFTVKAHYPLEHLNATCVYMVHDQTGAQLTYVACEDTERAFDITFRTPTVNDKGIPHVFEHATLCGSDKYPDPSLFFSMIYQTYNTFLNAVTMQSCTSFPAASLSEEQLYVYADYFLSGVFHPLIMTDERAMMREAYRYELADADADITLAGTVYSEMQGALSPLSRAGYNLKKLLYPGSVTANISGGDPAVIPELTHQELQDFHDRYYHPSNSMIVLYGKLDLDRFLKLIDGEYLSKYERRDIVLSDDDYAPFEGFREQVYTVPVAADAVVQPTTMYGFSLSNATPQDQVLMGVIANALSMESSPFQKRYREKLPDANIAAGVDDKGTDFTLMFLAINVGEEDKDTFKTLTDEAIAEVLANGLDMSAVEAQCRRQHYADIIGRGLVGTGSTVAMDIGGYWGNTGDPFAYRAIMDVTHNLMTYVETDAFNETFRRLLSAPVRSALAVTVPEAGGLERQSAVLADKLAQKKAAMTPEEIAALVAQTADFAAWTSDNQQSAMLDEVKAVSVQTLPEEITRYSAEERMEGGLRVITAEAPLDDVVRVELGLDSSVLTFDQLQDYAILVRLLGALSTQKHSKAQLADALSDATFSFNASAGVIEYKAGGYRPTLSISWITTQDRLADSFALLDEVLYQTDFSNADLLRRALKENVTNNKAIAGLVPDYLLLNYAMPLVRESSRYAYYLNGDDNLRYQQAVTEMTDEELAALAQRMTVILDTLLNQNGAYLTCVGTAESIRQTVARASELYAKLDDQKRESVSYAGLLPQLETPLASVVEGTMQYNMMVASMEGSGFEDSGKMLAMNQLMKDKILLQVLRFENSAYGVGGMLNGKVVYVQSARDPNLAETYQVYESLGDRIRAIPLTQDDLDGYIVGVYSSLAAPLSAMLGATQAVSDALTGETTFDDWLRYMREVKQFCPEDVIAYAAVYDMLAEKGQKITVGGAEAIEQNRDLFKTILTTYVE